MSSLPLILNDDPERLIQLNQQGSVGWGGKNRRDDVFLIQSLLNLVPVREGGPDTKLKVDGASGPFTVAAISRFQKANKLKADGRIDVLGPTIRLLGPTLHNRSLLPMNVKGVEPVAPAFVAVLTGKGGPPIVSRAERFPFAPFTPKGGPSSLRTTSAVGSPFSPKAFVGSTGWDFVTSSGADISAWLIGVGIINIFMKHDTEPGLVYRFTWAGAGAGVSLAKGGFDFSTAADFPSVGTRMVKFNPFIGKNPPISAIDLDLLPTCILSAGASGGPAGVNFMAVFWGAPGPLLPLARYFNFIVGAQAGTPNAGATLYVGAIAGFT